jgi:hypothetical protein
MTNLASRQRLRPRDEHLAAIATDSSIEPNARLLYLALVTSGIAMVTPDTAAALMGWARMRAVRAASVLTHRGLITREQVPVMGGMEIRYTVNS